MLSGVAFAVTTLSTGRLAVSSEGMVAAGNPYAAAAGAEILEKGGNAIDAAIAVSLALGVVEPYASGIGGEGYAVVSMAEGEKIAVDFRSLAPAMASLKTAAELNLEVKDIKKGPKSTCVPGVLDGIIKMWQFGGSLPFAELVAPAIRLAKEGFIVNKTFASTCGDNYEMLSENAPSFLNNGFAWEEGDLATNPELAVTLQYLADNGPKAFYTGTLANKIEAFMKENGGFMRKSDLENYQALVKDPLHGTYRGYDLFVPSIPVGGPYLIETLNILEHFNLAAFEWDDPLVMSIINQALTFAMIDLLSYSGDPAFVDVPVKALISKEYAKTRFMNIDLNSALDPTLYYTEYLGKPQLFEDTDSYIEALLQEQGVTVEPSNADVGQDTTHFAVIDKAGNAVAWTQTLSSFFGSGVYIDGFFINNEMGNFTLDETSRGLVPGKRPVTTICPTIIEKDGRVVYLIGTPGGYFIQSTITNVIVDLIDFGMTLDEAQRAPKFIGTPLYTEFLMEAGFPQATKLFLEKIMGHTIREFPFPFRSFGSLNLIQVEPDGLAIGIGALRREGGAAAPDLK